MWRIIPIIFVPKNRVIFLSRSVRVGQYIIFRLAFGLGISPIFTFLRRRYTSNSILRGTPNSILGGTPSSILRGTPSSILRRRTLSSILSGQSSLFSSLLSSCSSPGFFSSCTLIWNNSLVGSGVIILYRLSLRTTINID